VASREKDRERTVGAIKRHGNQVESEINIQDISCHLRTAPPCPEVQPIKETYLLGSRCPQAGYGNTFATKSTHTLRLSLYPRCHCHVWSVDCCWTWPWPLCILLSPLETSGPPQGELSNGPWAPAGSPGWGKWTFGSLWCPSGPSSSLFHWPVDYGNKFPIIALVCLGEGLTCLPNLLDQSVGHWILMVLL
jgi:hypothetical protein